MYTTGESSRRRDDDALPSSSYNYSDNEASVPSSSSAPDARLYRPKQMNHPHQLDYSDHFDASGRLSYNDSRQYAAVSDVRIAGPSSNPYPSHSSSYPSGYLPPLSYTSSSIPHTTKARRIGYPATLNTSDTGLQSPDYPYPNVSVPPSALTDASGDSDNWHTSSPPDPPPEQPKPARKSRRTKEKIALAPDQPPTTQGKPRARVYVACLQCRSRKIRCDGAKPICHNCNKRTSGGSDCNYDNVPKRRGPDKTPGARQRMARELKLDLEKDGPRRRRRRVDPPSVIPTQSPVSTNSSSSRGGPAFPVAGVPLTSLTSSDHLASPGRVLSDLHRSQESYAPDLRGCSCHGLDPCPNTLLPASTVYIRKHQVDGSPKYLSPSHEAASTIVSRGYIRPIYSEENEDDQVQNISNQPSSEFTRKTWWDSLISLYVPRGSDYHYASTHSERSLATQTIVHDLRFLFRHSNYWFSFFHLPTFFSNFHDDTRRDRMQPGLIYAILAMSVFWQSSEDGLGRQGRERALRLKDRAQSELEASYSSGWIDETLAQAAWLLALFEICAHPDHNLDRSMGALATLDRYIRSLSLTMVDVGNPQATHFLPQTVPAVNHLPNLALAGRSDYELDNRFDSAQHPHRHHGMSPSPPPVKCQCVSLTLGINSPETIEHTPMWANTPAWDPSWSEGDIRKESCRRLCWSALTLAAGHVAYASSNHEPGPDLFLAEPANYSLLLSGESITRPGASKDTIWALFDRSFLLWHGCARMRYSDSASESEKAQFAVKAWLEADAIEANLNTHVCDIERAFIFQAREYVFNTRMCISHDFSRFVPLISSEASPHRKKAEEWLARQAAVAQRFMYGLSAVTGNQSNLLGKRPFFVFWFMGQINNAMNLWQFDNSLLIALDVSKAFIPAIEYLTGLWPCPRQRIIYGKLRQRLNQACYIAGIAPPPPSAWQPSRVM